MICVHVSVIDASLRHRAAAAIRQMDGSKMAGRDGVTDALKNRDDCLAAITSGVDLETQRSLWRAALRYAQLGREKMRAETGGEYPAPALSTVGGAGGLVNSVER